MIGFDCIFYLYLPISWLDRWAEGLVCVGSLYGQRGWKNFFILWKRFDKIIGFLKYQKFAYKMSKKYQHTSCLGTILYFFFNFFEYFVIVYILVSIDIFGLKWRRNLNRYLPTYFFMILFLSKDLNQGWLSISSQPP